MTLDSTMAIGGPADDRPTPQQQPAYQVERWLDPCAVMLDVELRNRRHALEVISVTIGRVHRLDPEPVLRALWRRELVGSTALGCGFAIPHARIEGIAQPGVLYLRSKMPIDFAAPDGKPVRHVLAIAVPVDGDAEAHLALLAAIATMTTERAFREGLAAADDDRAVRRAFADFAPAGAGVRASAASAS